MARTFYKYPPAPSSGQGTFSDNLVGFQLVTGGGLTQGNFEFTEGVSQKSNRSFSTGVFSEPISLDTLNISSLSESFLLIQKNYSVLPNLDYTKVTNFSIYGPLTKRISSSIETIIYNFPAALEVSFYNLNFTTGNTGYNIVYDEADDLTSITIDCEKIRNPFGIDYSTNATINLQNKSLEISPLRNFYTNFSKYSLYVGDESYRVEYIVAPTTVSAGTLTINVEGKPFTSTTTQDYLIIRPNDGEVNKVFNQNFDEVENFLLNRLITPPYTAQFKVTKEQDDGILYTYFENVTWPLDGVWNLDIRTDVFDNYLTTLGEISESLDNTETNTLTRFLTTESFKEFDTSEQKVQKVLNIYGRSFDEVKRFIDGIRYVNSVTYNVGDSTPNELLKNIAQTIGWSTNISLFLQNNFVSSVYGNTQTVQYDGYSRALTDNELNYQFYRNLILNSGYLYKSKGTRKAVEFVMRLVGAPDALVEFNENVYIADQKINMQRFDTYYSQISGGTYVEQVPEYDTTTLYTIQGQQFTGITNGLVVEDVTTTRSDYPVNSDGYPSIATDSADYFFQKGAGWYELNRQHQSPLVVNQSTSVFSGQSPNVQTEFENFSYGQKYLDRYRVFPFMYEGFKLERTIDNKKSWNIRDLGLRVGDGSGLDAYYFIDNEKLLLNVKNVDLFLNPGQGLSYDVWDFSKKYNYPIPSSGFTNSAPQPGGIDSTFINPQPDKKDFFEFAATFWQTMINTRNRQTISDGKTGGYPFLQSIYWNYLQSNQNIGIPSDNYNYQSMIDYVYGMGTGWMNIVSQFIPATTLWMGGTRFENSIFHKQKFVYRIQPGCNILPEPCKPCSVDGPIFPYDCVSETSTCYIYPWFSDNPTATSFQDILGQTLNTYLLGQGKTINDCITNTLVSDWYVDLRLDDEILVQDKFYTGYGLIDVPTNLQWKNAINSGLSDLVYTGLTYSFNGNLLTIESLSCVPSNRDKTLSLNVGINFNIICN